MTTKKTSPASTTSNSDREIVISRVVNAPRELVWQAWTDPKHVVKWWGPRGFSDTTKKMDFRVGGVWEHVMRGPDGVNYPNKSTFKEIVPLERIVYSHGGGREKGPGATFIATWTFETVEGNKTKLTGRMVFPTADMRELVVREFGAIEGGRQTLERLSEYLPSMQMPAFVLEREFDAPRQLVWDAWTKGEHLGRWFGPKGCTLRVGAFEFKPGGIFHYGIKMPDGLELWGKWTFREIVAPEKLVVITSFSDAKLGQTRHPLNATWPLETLSTTTLTERNGRTRLVLHWIPYEATAEERQSFDGARPSMSQGWGGTMEQLTTYLAEVQKKALNVTAKVPERQPLVVSRRFDAPAEVVFDAWLDPASAGRWLFATADGEMVRVEIDARVGGKFLFADRRGGEVVDHVGTYLEIDRPRRLVFTFGVPKYSAELTRVSIDIRAGASGCELTLTHEGVLPDYRERTTEGWTGILAQLAKTLPPSPTSRTKA